MTPKATPYTAETLPAPPADLSSGEVSLQLAEIVPSNPPRGFVPYYRFRILLADGTEIGHLNFRVGDTDHVRDFAGHIGFGIHAEFRGRGYARQACRAVAPFVRTIYEAVTITCDPDNAASRRTIENLGAAFVDEAMASSHDPLDERGPRPKRRYRWTPT